jgi:hypothetical protein
MMAADVLIVCGQGTYENGEYSAEFPDRDVYLDHAISVKAVAERFAYSHIVCSGGFTQPGMRHVSEAQSFQAMWQDTNSVPNQPVFLDEYSLDSAENVYLGLMVARGNLGIEPIRRVGVFAAWDFKKPRFNMVAKELGIVSRFYFHGFAPASRANAGERALAGENKFLSEMSGTEDYLLLLPDAALKREGRYCGKEDEPDYQQRHTAYPDRLNPLRKQFPDVFRRFDSLCTERNSDVLEELRTAFKQQVIK